MVLLLLRILQKCALLRRYRSHSGERLYLYCLYYTILYMYILTFIFAHIQYIHVHTWANYYNVNTGNLPMNRVEPRQIYSSIQKQIMMPTDTSAQLCPKSWLKRAHEKAFHSRCDISCSCGCYNFWHKTYCMTHQRKCQEPRQASMCGSVYVIISHPSVCLGLFGSVWVLLACPVGSFVRLSVSQVCSSMDPQ